MPTKTVGGRKITTADRNKMVKTLTKTHGEDCEIADRLLTQALNELSLVGLVDINWKGKICKVGLKA